MNHDGKTLLFGVLSDLHLTGPLHISVILANAWGQEGRVCQTA